HIDLALDWRMLAFTAAVTSLTCVLLGLAPALRTAGAQPVTAIKAGARGLTRDHSRFAFQRLLVVVQVSVALVLVASALLFVASFRRLITMDPASAQKASCRRASIWADRITMKLYCANCSPRCAPHRKWNPPPPPPISSSE